MQLPAAVASVLILSAACTGAPDPTPLERGPTSVVFTRSGIGRSADTDLFQYRWRSDSLERLTRDGEARVEHDPRFSLGDEVTYVVSDPFPQILQTGAGASMTSVLVEHRRGSIISHDWHEGRHLMAYLLVRNGLEARVYDPSTGDTRFIRRFGDPSFREWGADDEVLIRWAPNGRWISVVNTFTGGPTLHVFNLRGRDVVPARRATLPRWAPDENVLYFRDYDVETPGWRAMEMGSGTATSLGLTPGTVHPAVSPDGRWLAASADAAGSPVYLLDLETDTEREIGQSLVAPLFLAEDTLAVSPVENCSVSRCGVDTWAVSGPAISITIADGRETPLALPFTRSPQGGSFGDPDVRY